MKSTPHKFVRLTSLAMTALLITACQSLENDRNAALRAHRSIIESKEAGSYVYLRGAVDGRIAWTEESTVLDVIPQAKIGDDAAIDRVLLVRSTTPEPVVEAIDVRAMVRNGDMTKNARLEPRDLLYFPRR